jgi:hypothetical protein
MLVVLATIRVQVQAFLTQHIYDLHEFSIYFVFVIIAVRCVDLLTVLMVKNKYGSHSYSL